MALTPEERNQFYYGNPPAQRSLTDFIPSMNSLSGLIPTEIPNVFGQRNPMYEGLLGVPQSQALSRQSNIAGLLGAAAALAAGMSRQGPRRSGIQNVLSALGAGYGVAGNVAQQGLQNFALQQQAINQQLQREKTLRDLQREQAAIGSIDELIKADPSIDPAMKAYLLNNKDKALEMYMQRQNLQKFMAGRQTPTATAPSAEMVAYNEQMAPYTTSGGETRVIPQAAPVREPTGKLAPGTVETAPVPEPFTGKFEALPTAPKAAPPVNPLEAQIRNADLMAEYFQSQVGVDPEAGVKVKQQQDIAKDLRGQQRQQNIIVNPAAALTNIHPTLQNRVATFNERAKGMLPDQVITEQNDILKDDANIKKELSQDIFNQKLKLSAAQGSVSYETPTQRFERSSSLRKEYQGIQVVKDFDQVKVAYNQISGALKNASPANDLAAATKFMKLLDPGSVVRESELGMAMSASPAMERVTNYFNQLKTGEKLTPTQREDFRKSAEMLYKASENVIIPIQNEYRGIAASAGISPRNVIIETPSSISSSQPSTSNVPLPGGVKVRKVQ
jgi:hypothetical protein